jgi:uncharacterized membrane protein
MATPGPPKRHAEIARQAGQSVYQTALDVVLTGIAVIVPIVVTIYVLNIALGFIAGALAPLVRILEYFGIIGRVKALPVIDFLLQLDIIASGVTFVSELIAIGLLACCVIAVGIVARFRYGEQVIEYFDHLVTLIPGVGTVYKSFRRMGDVMLESEVDNFRSVKLVEFPTEGSFVIGFETARPPSVVRDSAGSEEMMTLFLPLAPNPVMGGFLSHMPTDRVHDVDMTVEEGVRSIVTSGIATQDDAMDGYTADELEELGIDEDDIPPAATEEPEAESGPADAD